MSSTSSSSPLTSVSGLASGLDWQSIISELKAADEQSVTLVQQSQTNTQNQLSAWQSFNTQLLALKTAAEALNTPADFDLLTTNMTSDNSAVSASTLMSASASSDATPGSYQIQVLALAQADKQGSVFKSSSSQAMGISGTLAINGQDVNISSTDSLTDIQNNINALDSGSSPTNVTATILNYGSSGYRLVLTSDVTGSSGITLVNKSGNVSSLGFQEIQPGKDVSISVDGQTVSESSNTIDDVIPGVTLNLLQADTGTTVTLNVSRDLTSIMNNIQSFVSAYNNVISSINTQNSYDTTTNQTGGVLFGDGTLASIKDDMNGALLQQVSGVNPDYSTLGLVGIDVGDDGTLSVDTSTLQGYLQSNFNDIVNLFTDNGSTSSSDLQYVSNTSASQPGQYLVHITTAAQKSTSDPSSTAVDTTLGGNENLTVDQGGKTAVIGLTSSMSITDIVNALNSEFANVYTQTLAGSNQLYSDAVQGSAITSSTTWNDVYDNSGNLANLANGDVISFTGTDHSGSPISGSYTINDTSTDTVQGLLTAIENAFNNTVTASINSSGRITVTDNNSGNSQLSLNIDSSQAHNLNFGTVLTSNQGAGRPDAMPWI